MTTRRISGVVLVLCLAGLTARAQQVNPGTVSWATGYPKAINLVEIE